VKSCRLLKKFGGSMLHLSSGLKARLDVIVQAGSRMKTI
jgi:hypothetical protein